MRAAEERGSGLNMWEPLKFETPEGFDYLRSSRRKTAFYRGIRAVFDAILRPLDRVCWGLRIEGRENLAAVSGGCVSVCNHVHAMDCTFVDLALAPAERRVYYMTLESNFRIPFIRGVIRVAGGVPLPERAKPLAEMFRALEAAVRSGADVQVYPEGEMLPYGRGLRPFRDGAFYLAAKCGVPVLPMVITYRASGRRRPPMTLTVLPPIRPPEGASLRAAQEYLRAEAFRAMDAACK